MNDTDFIRKLYTIAKTQQETLKKLAQRFGDDYMGSPEQLEREQHAPPPGGDDEALGEWQDREDKFRNQKNIAIGDAWRKLSTETNYFTQVDFDRRYEPLEQAIKQVHDVMNDLEINYKINFFNIKRY
jgi:hypothetical protein